MAKKRYLQKVGSSVLSDVPNYRKANNSIIEYDLDFDEIAFIREADLRKNHIVEISNSITFPNKTRDDAVRYKAINEGRFGDAEPRRSTIMYGEVARDKLIEKGILKYHAYRELKDQDKLTYKPLQWTKLGEKIRSNLKPKTSGKIKVISQGKKIERHRKETRITMGFEKGKKIIIVKEYEAVTQPYKQTRVENIAGIFRLDTYRSTSYNYHTPQKDKPGPWGNQHKLEIDLGDKAYNQQLVEFISNNGIDVGVDTWHNHIVIADNNLIKATKLIKEERELVVEMLNKGVAFGDYTTIRLIKAIKAWKALT